jgi:hypothetical protein
MVSEHDDGDGDGPTAGWDFDEPPDFDVVGGL